MTEAEFREAFHKRFNHVPPSRRATAVDNIVAADAQNSVKVWELPDAWWLENAIDKAMAAYPKLFESAPTVAQLLELSAKAYVDKMGTPFSPQQRLAEHRRLETMDGDARVAELGDRELPKIAETPAAPAVPAPVDDVAALDAEVGRRFGKTWPNISATERRRYHEILKNEKRVSDNASVHDDAALARVGGDTSKLNPIDRLSAFRAQQAAKATNGA